MTKLSKLNLAKLGRRASQIASKSTISGKSLSRTKKDKSKIKINSIKGEKEKFRTPKKSIKSSKLMLKSPSKRLKSKSNTFRLKKGVPPKIKSTIKVQSTDVKIKDQIKGSIIERQNAKDNSDNSQSISKR